MSWLVKMPKMLSHEPKQVDYYYYCLLSQALVELKLYSEAIGICDDGLRVEPRDPNLLERMRDCRAILAV